MFGKIGDRFNWNVVWRKGGGEGVVGNKIGENMEILEVWYDARMRKSNKMKYPRLIKPDIHCKHENCIKWTVTMVGIRCTWTDYPKIHTIWFTVLSMYGCAIKKLVHHRYIKKIKTELATYRKIVHIC